MRLSRTAIRVLSAQYRSVLKKCLLINLGVFFFAGVAGAKDFTTGETLDGFKGAETLNVSNVENVTIKNVDSTGAGIEFVFDNAQNVKIENSDLETDGGNVSITNTKDFSYSCVGCYDDTGDNPEEYYSKYMLGEDVNISGSTITLGTDDKMDDYARISANRELNITNKSEITMYGSSALVYEGTEADDGTGVVSISDSKLSLYDKSALWVGEPGWWLGQDENNDATAPLLVSNSEISLNDDASVNFAGNGAETIIQNNSSITMNDRSSMKLNDLVLKDSTITISGDAATSDGKARLEVNNVTLDNSSILGDNNIVDFSGEVDFTGLFDPATANVKGNLTRGGYDDDITYNITGTLTYTNDKFLYDAEKHGSEYALNSLNFKGGQLNIVNDEASEIKLTKLSLNETSTIALDADLENKKMDRFSADTVVDGSGKLNISKINLISDAKDAETVINFTQNQTLLEATDYTGDTNGLKALSPVYTYDVAYDKTNGDFTFTRGSGASVSDYNPAVYAASVVGHTVDFLQTNVANVAFDNLAQNLDDGKQGLASGDLPKANNAWVSVIGFDDSVDFDKFQSVDSDMTSVIGGVSSDVQLTDLGDVTYGVYAGYMHGEIEYDGNKINQDGGYIGLGTRIEKGNAVVQGAVNGGFIGNEEKNSFGKDKFDTYWAGLAVKGGYDYKLDNGVTIQPNVYAGYTFVNNEDYTLRSGTKIENDNLHLFEVAPGIKLSKDFQNGWNGFAQVKYAFVMDNGGDLNVGDAVLPNISADDYVEYGVGLEKTLNDEWDLSASVNRRDGGREGWNGSVNFRYNF